MAVPNRRTHTVALCADPARCPPTFRFAPPPPTCNIACAISANTSTLFASRYWINSLAESSYSLRPQDPRIHHRNNNNP
eukprot:11224490-Prorocentrum_lima.AAC.1